VVRGLRLYILFRGNPSSAKIKNKEGRFVKHIRFVDSAGRWAPRSASAVEAQLPDIIERVKRLYQGRADVLSVRVEMLTGEDTERLRLKPGHGVSQRVYR
jgi:hypothetical protein